jgi:hypothetical protein
VGEEDMRFYGHPGEKVVAQNPQPCSPIEDQAMVINTKFDTGRITAVPHSIFAGSWDLITNAPKLHINAHSKALLLDIMGTRHCDIYGCWLGINSKSIKKGKPGTQDYTTQYSSQTSRGLYRMTMELHERSATISLMISQFTTL